VGRAGTSRPCPAGPDQDPFAQPFLVLRLIDQIRPVSRIRMRIAVLGALAAWACVVLLPAAIPAALPLGIVFAVFYFFAVEIAAAAAFARYSRRRYGVVGMDAPHDALQGVRGRRGVRRPAARLERLDHCPAPG
jgi:hypothetical protein